MYIPLPDVRPSGSYEDAPGPASTAPETNDYAEIPISMSGSKRPHTENEGPSDAPHPTKTAKAPQGKARAAPIRRAVTKRSRADKPVAAARAAPPVAGSSNLARAAVDRNEPDAGDKSDDDKDPACIGIEARETRTKRDRRTKAQVAAVTQTGLPKISCPVEGCETMSDPLTHDANREHLKTHYDPGALDAKASLPCVWSGCEERKAGTRKITRTRTSCGPGVHLFRSELPVEMDVET